MSPHSPESRPHGRLPDALDAWRMVAARRGFQGSVPLSSMPRLRGMLHDDEGEVRFTIDFDRDALQVPYVELSVEAALPLLCQRSLQRFLLPVKIVQRLALVQEGAAGDMEAIEAGLPPDYEPLPVPEDGTLRPLEVIEDELILVVPVVPVSPDGEALAQDWPVPEEEAAQASPFAALAKLKSKED